MDKSILQENKKLVQYENFVQFYRTYTSYLDQDIIDIAKIAEMSRGNADFHRSNINEDGDNQPISLLEKFDKVYI